DVAGLVEVAFRVAEGTEIRMRPGQVTLVLAHARKLRGEGLEQLQSLLVFRFRLAGTSEFLVDGAARIVRSREIGLEIRGPDQGLGIDIKLRLGPPRI